MMIHSWTMGNTTNPLSLCVSQSSRKNRRERPYVSRPFWPYEYHRHVNSTNGQHRELSPIHLSSTVVREMSPSRSIQIVKMPSRNS